MDTVETLMERPLEDWGRLAVSLPGWRWMPGMREGRTGERYEDGDGPWIVRKWPDPDDPATAGCLLALLGPGAWDNVAPGSVHAADGEGWWAWVDGEWSEGLTLGRACIAAAVALGEWPNGAESGRMEAE